jgi:hypothetical protein
MSNLRFPGGGCQFLRTCRVKPTPGRDVRAAKIDIGGAMNATQGSLETAIPAERCLIEDEGRSLAAGVQA